MIPLVYKEYLLPLSPLQVILNIERVKHKLYTLQYTFFNSEDIHLHCI